MTLKEYKAAKAAMAEDLRQAGEVHRRRILASRRKQARDFALRMQEISDEYALDNVHLALAPYFNLHQETRRRWAEAQEAKRVQMIQQKRVAKSVAVRKELAAKRKAHREKLRALRAAERKEEQDKKRRRKEGGKKISKFWAEQRKEKRRQEEFARQMIAAEKLKRKLENTPNWILDLVGKEVWFCQVGSNDITLKGTVIGSTILKGKYLLRIKVPYSAKPMWVSINRVIL